MHRTILFLLASLSLVFAQDFPELLNISFTDGHADGWKASGNGTVTWVTDTQDAGLLCVCDEAGDALLQQDLKPELFAGKRIWISAEYKVEQKIVKSNGRHWLGGKAQFCFSTTDGTSGYPNTIPSKTVDDGTQVGGWQTGGAVVDVPSSLKSASLMIGLQGATGAIRIRNLRIRNCPPLPKRPEYKPYPIELQKTTQYRGVMSGSFGVMTKEAIETLAAWNVNLIRFQIKTEKLDHGTRREAFLGGLEKWLDSLDAMLVHCQKHGIKVVIDLHRGPAQTGNGNTLTEGAEHNAILVEAWQRIATRYKGNPVIYGYDILNEPFDKYPASELACGHSWTEITELVTAAIRKIDPDTPIIIETEWGGSFDGFKLMKPIQFPNIIYSAHFYTPSSYTHQGINGPKGPVYPGTIDKREWNKEELRKAMQVARDFQLKYNVPIYVGEFSAVIWGQGADAYLDDCMSLFEEYGWDYCYHAFREAACWNVEYEGTRWEDLKPAKTPTPRLKSLLKYFKLNKR